MATNFRSAKGSHSKRVSIPNDFVPVTANSDCPDGTRGILCNADGTVTLTMSNGQTRENIPVLNGVILPGDIKHIGAVSGPSLIFAIT